MNISDLLLPNELSDEATSPGTGCSPSRSHSSVAKKLPATALS